MCILRDVTVLLANRAQVSTTSETLSYTSNLAPLCTPGVDFFFSYGLGCTATIAGSVLVRRTKTPLARARLVSFPNPLDFECEAENLSGLRHTKILSGKL